MAEEKKWSLDDVRCMICGEDRFKVLGIRGNREYSGADPQAEPHVTTNVVKCKNCGFIYTNPMIRGFEHLEHEHYRNTDKYEATRADSDRMFGSRVAMIKKFKPQGSLLDVGAGKGEFLSAAKSSFNVEGVEPSAQFCEYAEKEYGVKMHCGLVGEVEELKGCKYDVVTMLHVLEHVEDPQQLIPLLKEYLNDDGLLMIEVPNTESFFLKIIDIYYKVRRLGWSSRLSPLHPPFHRFGYNPRSLRFLLEKHGFEVLQVKTLSGKDRGFEKKSGVKAIEVFLRDMVTNMIELLGSRELLVVFAKPLHGK